MLVLVSVVFRALPTRFSPPGGCDRRKWRQVVRAVCILKSSGKIFQFCPAVACYENVVLSKRLIRRTLGGLIRELILYGMNVPMNNSTIRVVVDILERRRHVFDLISLGEVILRVGVRKN